MKFWMFLDISMKSACRSHLDPKGTLWLLSHFPPMLYGDVDIMSGTAAFLRM